LSLDKRRKKMEVKKAAMAGTLESSDAQVTVEPGNGIELSIESSVIHQFGKQIKATILETLDRLDVKNAKVTVVDKGALDCTLKARVECAVYRSNDITENLPWGGVIR
jgi:citrate lyase subunit gamma (acyl carrier protein)